MRWIRKGNFIAAAVVALALAVLGYLFLDSLARWALIKAGQAAAGAKVEIAAVHLSVLKGRLEISQTTIADKNEPMKNLVQFDRAVLRFDPAAAIRAKAVIPQAELLGLRFGTPRRRSGTLRRARPSKLEQQVQRELAPAKAEALSKLGQVKKIKTEVDPKSLASLKALDEADRRVKKIGEAWKDRLKTDQIDREIQRINDDAKALKEGDGSPADIGRRAEAAQKLQGRIKGLLRDVQTSRDALNQEFGEVQGGLKKAQDLKGQDVRGLLAAAGLPAIDAESLARKLVGPQAAAKLSTAIYWISWARKRASASPAAKAEAPPRRRGVNVEFPLQHAYPQFLIERAALSGTLADLFQGRDMALEGALMGVTSNPPLYGKPLRLSLKGTSPGGGPTMGLEGSLDQTGPASVTELSLHCAGLPLAGSSLGDGELGAGVKAGIARLNGTVRVMGDEWRGQVLVQADGVLLEPHVSLTGPAAAYATAALRGVRRFQATIGFEGKAGDLRFRVNSDLGQMVADGVKKAISGELSAQRRQLEDKVNALYAQKAKDVQGQASGLQSSLLGPLNRQQAQLEGALKDAMARSLGRSVPGLDKLFR